MVVNKTLPLLWNVVQSHASLLQRPSCRTPLSRAWTGQWWKLDIPPWYQVGNGGKQPVAAGCVPVTAVTTGTKWHNFTCHRLCGVLHNCPPAQGQLGPPGCSKNSLENTTEHCQLFKQGNMSETATTVGLLLLLKNCLLCWSTYWPEWYISD